MPDLPVANPTPPAGSPGRPPTIAPRQSFSINLIETRAKQQSSQADANAAKLRSQEANLTIHTAQQMHHMGQDILEPFNQLAKAREITRANDIVIASSIELNGQLQAIKSSGAKPEELLSLTDQVFNKIASKAIEDSKGISPAATEFVTRQLQQTKLSTYTHMQKEAFERDINDQLASLQRLSTFSRQSFFLTDDPVIRDEVRKNLFSNLSLYAQTGLITADAAQQAKTDFDKFVASESGTYLARAVGLPAAFQFIEENTVLSPDEKRVARNKAEDAVRAEMAALEAEDKRLEKELKLSQEVISAQLRKTILDPKTPITLLQSLFQQVPDLTSARALDGGDSETILTLLQKSIEERTGPPKEDDEDAFLRQKIDILFSPNGKSPNEIAGDSGLTMETKGRLLDDLSNVRNRENYTNSPVFKNLVSEIEAVVPKNMLLQFTFDEKKNIELFIQRSITSFERYISRSAGADGILPDETILKIGTPLKDQIIEELVKQKMPLSGRTIEELLKEAN